MYGTGGTGHPTGTIRDGSTTVATKTIRADVYNAMREALTSNTGFIYRGRDRQDGPQAGLGTLLMLARRGWVRLVRAKVENARTGQIHHEVAGAWVLAPGRTALRNEITRRGDAMPARLALPTRTATPAHPVAPAAPATRPHVVTALFDRPRSLTTWVDPFALIGTGARRFDLIPF